MPNRSEIIANPEGRATMADMAIKGMYTRAVPTRMELSTADSDLRGNDTSVILQKQTAPYDSIPFGVDKYT